MIDHNVKMFILLNALSMIPWMLAFVFKRRQTQWSLALVDATLTIWAYVYLFHTIGWWVLFVVIVIGCIFRMLEDVGVKPYDNLA